MSHNKVESPNSCEILSPAEKNGMLKIALLSLPKQLTLGEPQMVENLKFINYLSELLEFSRGTKGSTRFILDTAAYATEVGVEAVVAKPERFDPEESFPKTLFNPLDPEGLFGDNPHLTEQRGLIFLSKNREASRNNSREHKLYVVWWADYVTAYHHDPF